MKLKRAIISMLLILSMTTQVFAASIPPTKVGFPDINGHWAENYINDFQKNGIIKGYPDGTFRPDIDISRAEFASLLYHLLKLEKTVSNDFDSEEFCGSWAEDYLNVSVYEDIIDLSEYENGYDYNGAITRLEIAKMIIRSLDKDNIARNIKSAPGFIDDELLKSNDYGYVYLAKYYELVAGYPDGTFRPDNHSTRAETVKMLVSRNKASDRIANENRPSPSAPKAVIDFKLPEYTHTDKAVDFDFTSRNARSLNWSLKKGNNDNELEDVDLSKYATMAVEDKSATIQFQDKGTYSLLASARNADNRLAMASSNITVYPVMDIQFGLLDSAYTDTELKVDVSTLEVNEHEIKWSLEKNGETINMSEAIEGSLNNDGGTIRFTQRGNYTLTASVTDEVGRTFEHRDEIKVYRLISTDFSLPETAHTDDFIDISVVESGLENYPIEWSLTKNGEVVEIDECLDGRLTNEGGRIRFTEKGTYILSANVTDETGRVFTKQDEIKVYPLIEATFDLPASTHTDEAIEVNPILSELGVLSIEWSLLRDGEPVMIDDYVAGTLDNRGGSVTFTQKGNYELKASITDELDRVFTFTDHIDVYPVVGLSFKIPETIHIDDSVEIALFTNELGTLPVEWSLHKDGEPVILTDYITGVLGNTGGIIEIPQKGNYEIIATVMDEIGREYQYSEVIKVYPLVSMDLKMIENTHTDESFDVDLNTEELGNLNVVWLLTKDGQEANIEDFVSGTLENSGGNITINAKGIYEFKAAVTDELGRTYTDSVTVNVYPVMSIYFDLPEYAHTDTLINVILETKELEGKNITWQLEKDGQPVTLATYTEGTLDNYGGAIKLTSRGSYRLLASASDSVGREFSFADNINMYPVSNFEISMPDTARIGEVMTLGIKESDTENMSKTWKLKKDSDYVNLSDYLTGELSNGKTISFGAAGSYTLEALLTDATGRSFTHSKSLEVINSSPLKPTISASVTRQISNGKFLVNLSVQAVDPDGDSITYEYDGKTNDNYYLPGTYTVKVRAKDQFGAYSDWASVQFTVVNNAPSTPVMVRTPDTNSVSPGTNVKITASSTDSDGDAISYIWEGRPAETSKYPLGKNVVKVKAVDAAGAESPWAAIVFFVADAENGGGMTLTSRDSTIIEQGISGATITEYTFNVPAVSGHSGSDYGRVKGYNIQTNQWDQLDYKTTNNGVYMAKTLPAGKYSKLEFYYYTSHSCMYNKSNITYTVKYHFE